MRQPSERGSALILTVVVLLILSILGVGMIRLTSRELAGATSARQSEALVSCAEAGRQLILSQFRTVSISPTSLEVLDARLGGQASRTRAVGGHVGSSVQVEQVTVLPSATFGVQRNSVRDLSNIVTGAAQLGGTPYRVVVHCQDQGTPGDETSGRQLEVEFGLRFGL